MKTRYVISGFWEDGTKVYYQFECAEKFFGIPIQKLTTSIDEATQYDSIELAEEVSKEVNSNIFKIYPVCPICGEDYDGHPAISRKDNKSEICPNCGIGEAFMDFIEHNKKTTNL